MQGLEWECRSNGKCNDDESSNSDPAAVLHSGLAHDSGVHDSPGIDQNSDDPGEQEFTTYKDDSALVDQQSTGRKRAAKMYPLDESGDCEWKLKKNCGGGKFPITGCRDGKQEARHHGPEKNTLNNDPGNVHRICHYCHNRWHTLNDPGYVWTPPYNPHSPIVATEEDLKESDKFWEGRKLVRARD